MTSSICARLLAATALSLTAAPVLAQAAGTPMAPTPAGAPTTAVPEGAVNSQSTAPIEAASTGSGNDIVVTAQRRSERLRDVPVTVNVQTGAMLKQANIFEIRELTTVVPGLNFTTQGAYAQPALRGLSDDNATPGSENGVAIYLDGIYQPGQQANLFDLPDIDNIEVLKGPQGTLFGRNATAGAILIQTLSPSFTPTGHVSLSAGAFDRRGMEFGGRAYVSGPISDTLAASVSGYDSYNTGFYHDILRDKRGGHISSQSIRAKILWKPTPDLRILLTGYYAHKDDEDLYNTVSVHPLVGSSPVATRKYDYANSTQGFLHLNSYGGSAKVEYDTGIGTITSLTGYAHSRMQLAADSDASNLPYVTYTFIVPNTTKSEELTFTSRKISGASLTAGFFAYRSKEAANPLAIGPDENNPLFRIYSRAGSKALAGFGQLSYDITDSLNATGGIRYSWERRTFDGTVLFDPTAPAPDDLTRYGRKSFHAWTPRASIRYAITPTANVYFTYAQGFKSGLFDTTAVFAPPPATPVDPERVKMYELGAKTTLTHGLDLNVSIFQEDVTNRQVESNTPSGLPILDNGADGRIRGLDGELSWQVSPSFSAHATVSWLPQARYTSFRDASILIYDPAVPTGVSATRDLTGTRFQKAPRVQSSLLLNYTTPIGSGRLDASANVSYSSGFHYDVSSNVVQRRYAKVNASVGWSPHDDKFKITAFVKNLTNKATFQSYLTPFNYIYAAPRELGMTVDVGF